MRVLNVIDGTGWCGTKEQTYLISVNLQRQGVESEMALAQNHKEMISRINGEIKLHFYGVHKGGRSRFNIKNLLKLRKIIQEGRYDAVIAHSSHAFDYVRLVIPFTRKPKVIAVRRSGFVPGTLSKHLKYRIADKIVVVSREVARLLAERGFFPEKLEVIESGIDLSRFKPDPSKREKVRRELGLRDNEYMFINVANWQPWRKGQEVILRALKDLPQKKFKMFFVGLGTDSKEAKETIARYGLEGRCVGLGFRADVDRLLQASDLFLFGSYSEGIAGAVLQAMACGNIVVSTDAGGIKEYLVDKVNGFSVKVGDSVALSHKIEYALNLGKAEKDRISREAVKTAQKFSIENTVKKYIDLLESIV